MPQSLTSWTQPWTYPFHTSAPSTSQPYPCYSQRRPAKYIAIGGPNGEKILFPSYGFVIKS